MCTQQHTLTPRQRLSQLGAESGLSFLIFKLESLTQAAKKTPWAANKIIPRREKAGPKSWRQLLVKSNVYVLCVCVRRNMMIMTTSNARSSSLAHSLVCMCVSASDNHTLAHNLNRNASLAGDLRQPICFLSPLSQ